MRNCLQNLNSQAIRAKWLLMIIQHIYNIIYIYIYIYKMIVFLTSHLQQVMLKTSGGEVWEDEPWVDLQGFDFLMAMWKKLEKHKHKEQKENTHEI